MWWAHDNQTTNFLDLINFNCDITNSIPSKIYRIYVESVNGQLRSTPTQLYPHDIYSLCWCWWIPLQFLQSTHTMNSTFPSLKTDEWWALVGKRAADGERTNNNNKLLHAPCPTCPTDSFFLPFATYLRTRACSRVQLNTDPINTNTCAFLRSANVSYTRAREGEIVACIWCVVWLLCGCF